jgi:hypothetical protein
VTTTLYKKLTRTENHLETFQLLSAANYCASPELFVTSGAEKGELFTSEGKFDVTSILSYLLTQLESPTLDET